jgi:hypothetical protein
MGNCVLTMQIHLTLGTCGNFSIVHVIKSCGGSKLVAFGQGVPKAGDLRTLAKQEYEQRQHNPETLWCP